MFPGMWYIGLLQSVTEIYHMRAPAHTHTHTHTHRGLYCSESQNEE